MKTIQVFTVVMLIAVSAVNAAAQERIALKNSEVHQISPFAGRWQLTFKMPTNIQIDSSTAFLPPEMDDLVHGIPAETIIIDVSDRGFIVYREEKKAASQVEFEGFSVALEPAQKKVTKTAIKIDGYKYDADEKTFSFTSSNLETWQGYGNHNDVITTTILYAFQRVDGETVKGAKVKRQTRRSGIPGPKPHQQNFVGERLTDE